MANFSRIEIVSSFRTEENLILLLGNSIRKINDRLNGKFFQVNIPADAPPELPRCAIQLKNILIHIGLNRIQIIAEPPLHVQGSIQESFTFIKETAEFIISSLFEDGLDYKWTGLITTIEFLRDAKSPIIAVAPIFKKLINLPWNENELASFNFQIGKKIDNHFINYHVHGYEKKEFKVEGITKGKNLKLHNLGGVIKEIGIQILLDINNKPKKQVGTPLGDFREIVEKQYSLSKSLIGDLNLEGVL